MGLTGWGCVAGVLGQGWKERYWRTGLVKPGDGARVGVELFGEIHRAFNSLDRSKRIRDNFKRHLENQERVDAEAVLLVADRVFAAVSDIADLVTSVVLVAEGENKMKLRPSSSVPDCLVEAIRERVSRLRNVTFICPPCEADSQLVFAHRSGQIDWVLVASQDSDMLMYGVSNLVLGYEVCLGVLVLFV